MQVDLSFRLHHRLALDLPLVMPRVRRRFDLTHQ
jgi:hypothetical protein